MQNCRRKTLVIILASEVVFATAGTVSSNNILCSLYRFLVGAATAGIFTTVFVDGKCNTLPPKLLIFNSNIKYHCIVLKRIKQKDNIELSRPSPR